jgi:hypothetical protein
MRIRNISEIASSNINSIELFSNSTNFQQHVLLKIKIVLRLSLSCGDRGDFWSFLLVKPVRLTQSLSDTHQHNSPIVPVVFSGPEFTLVVFLNVVSI